MTRAIVRGSIPPWVLSDRLEKARKHAGLSQSELAEAIDVGRRSITGYENGVRAPRRPVLIAWAMATGVDLEWLEYGDDAPTPDDGCPHQGSNLGPADYKSDDSHSLTVLAPVLPLSERFAA